MTTAEEALARAKAIASRLSGADSSAADTSEASKPNQARTKRNRWGVTSSTGATSSTIESLPGLAELKDQANKRIKIAPSSKRIWVKSTSERPESHFNSYFSTRLGSIADKINREEGLDNEKDPAKIVRIILKGRGSSDKPPAGVPEEPMHISISGPDTLIAKADILVDSLLVEAEQAPPENVLSENVSNNNLALTTISPPQQASGYRPATVAQLISGRPGIGGDDGPLIEEEVLVPNGMVGFLIGRGGETITSMQARSGCKVQIQKEHELRPGQTNRVITLQATSQEAIDQCREMIESMVQDRIRAAGGGGGGGKDGKVQEALAAGHVLVKVDVPDGDVGLIIGKGGATIKSIQESTGASIQIPSSGNADNPSVRTLSVTHPNEQGANAAKQQIEYLLKSKPSYHAQNQGPQITVEIMVSASIK